MKKSITKTYIILLFIAGMMAVSGCKKSQIIDNPIVDPIETGPGGGGDPIVNPPATPSPYDPKVDLFSIDNKYMSPGNELIVTSNPTNFSIIFSVGAQPDKVVKCLITVVLTNNSLVVKKELSEKYGFFTDGLTANYKNKSLNCKVDVNSIAKGDQVGLKLEYFDSNNKLVSVISGTRYSITTTPPTQPSVNRPIVPNIPENEKYIVPGKTYVGYNLLAKNGTYHLDLQEDGNLVLYQNGYDPLWNSKTGNYGRSTLRIDDWGTMYITPNSDSRGRSWSGSLSRNPKSSIWVLQDDGNLVCYEGYSVDASGHVTTWGEALGATMTQNGTGSRHQGKFI
ncbi:hypothetical protein HDF26_004538 [Pedobacter cryoconitis]|uniref:hypothetical protein n=1 Tax=Pedobacter cryoconitis TaxID=188932 RepID=UPI00160C2F75|nr:hypothetical protein [Pedobacter cryoconitis]MBB6274065.1 hypothetical protein [Pedobacter cryoconitis]